MAMHDWTVPEMLYAVLLVYGTLDVAAIALRRFRRWRDASDARRERSRLMRRIVWRRVRALDPERAGRQN